MYTAVKYMYWDNVFLFLDKLYDFSGERVWKLYRQAS
jgi:hypothetical protein